jgi:hypothetical protein
VRPLLQARVADLGAGDLVRFDCTACRRAAWLTHEFLATLGIEPTVKVLDLVKCVPCDDCGAEGRAIVWVKWAPTLE